MQMNYWKLETWDKLNTNMKEYPQPTKKNTVGE